jgi:hypothetical protein
MLEFNSCDYEHVFPIQEDYADFVAILDPLGIPIPQREAFAFYDHFGLNRVSASHHPPDELAAAVSRSRAVADNEGVVIYIEDRGKETIGLYKVKTDYYVKGRRTRETLWGAVVDPMRAGRLADGPYEHKGGGKGSGKKGGGGGGSAPEDASVEAAFARADRRIRNGMRTLTHVEGCAEHWEAWYAEATAFYTAYRTMFHARGAAGGAGGAAAQRAFVDRSRHKVRAGPGQLSARSVLDSDSLLYGVFVWAYRALNTPKWWFPARAVRHALRGVPRRHRLAGVRRSGGRGGRGACGADGPPGGGGAGGGGGRVPEGAGEAGGDARGAGEVQGGGVRRAGRP